MPKDVKRAPHDHLTILQDHRRVQYKKHMESHERPTVCPFVRRLLPDAGQAEQVAAQEHVDNVIACLYRICDRLGRNVPAAGRDNADVYATLDEQQPRV
jgi:hypothetical protein